MARYPKPLSVLLILAVVLAPACVWATNTSFLPGDAFFHTLLTADVVARFREEKNVSLCYILPPDPDRGFSGNAGFARLELTDVPRGMKQSIALLYQKLREREPAVFDELLDGSKHEANGFHLFAYNADFDFENRHLGLRYNENWVEEAMGFGHRRERVLLDEFVHARKAASQEWRDAASVKRLAAECPRSDTPRNGIEYDPVVLREGYVLVVVERENLDEYFLKKEGATFYTIRGDTIARYVVQLGEWNKHPWSAKE